MTNGTMIRVMVSANSVCRRNTAKERPNTASVSYDQINCEGRIQSNHTPSWPTPAGISPSWSNSRLVSEVDRNDLHIAAGYWALVSYTGVWLAAWISLLELFGLPQKHSPHSPSARWDENAAAYNSEGHSMIAASENISDDEREDTEETPLFRGAGRPPTFGGYSRTLGNTLKFLSPDRTLLMMIRTLTTSNV